MARKTDAGGVRRPAPSRHRTSLRRRVHRHHHGRCLLLPGLRSRTVPQHREVRIALRVAVLLRSGGFGCRDPERRQLTRNAPGRGHLQEVPQPPRSRLRGRGIPDADRSAVLHQLDLAGSQARSVARSWATPCHW